MKRGIQKLVSRGHNSDGTDAEKYAYLLALAEKYSEYEPEDFEYSELAEDLRKISGAAYAVINLLTPDGEATKTVAIAGIGKARRKAMQLLGFDPVGKEWKLDDFARKALTSHTLINRGNLEEIRSHFTLDIARRLQSAFGLTDIWSIGIFRKKRALGTIVLVTTKTRQLTDIPMVELFVHQVGNILFRIESELQLRTERNLLQNLSENSHDLLILIDKKLRIQYINRLLPGFTREEIIGANALSFVADKNKKEYRHTIQKVFHENRPAETIITSYGANREEAIYRVRLAPITEHKVVHSVYSIVTDITEESRARERIHDQLQTISRLESFIDSTTDGIHVTDETGRLIYCNKTHCERLGLDPTRISSYHIADFALRMRKKGTWAKEIQALKTSGPLTIETIQINVQTQEQIPVEVQIRAVAVEGKTYFVATSRDIRLRKQNEAIIEQQRTELEQILTALEESTILSVTDATGRITRVNKHFCDISGYSEKELIGKPHRIVNSGYHTKDFWRSMWQTISSGKTFRAQIRNMSKTGDFYWVDTVINPMLDANGNITHYLSIRQNITPRKEAELLLLESEYSLQEAQRIAKIGRWELDLIYNKLYWSPSIFDIFEINPTKFRATYEGFLQAIHPDDRAAVNKAYSNSLINKSSYSIEHRLLMPDGRIKWVKETCRTDYDMSGRATRSIGVVQDITESRNTASELLLTQKILERTSEVARIGGWELDLAADRLYWTDVVKDIHGVKKSYEPNTEEALAFYRDGHDRESITRAIEAASTKGEPFDLELQIVRADKKIIWVRAIGQAEFSDGRWTRVYGTFQDIDASKKREMKIIKQNEFRKLLADISTAFVKSQIANFDNVICETLEKCGRHFEVDRVFLIQINLVSQTASNTHDWHAPESKSFAHRIQNAPLSRFPWFAEKVFHQDLFTIADISRLPPAAEEEKKEWQAQQIGSILFVRIDINEIPVGVFGLARKTEGIEWDEEQIAGLRVIANAIADRLMKNKLEHEMLVARENADKANRAKSEFLANMSHEIRTPLNGVIGFTELLMNAELNKTYREYVSNANTSAHTLLEVINNILDFSKIEAGRLELDEVETDVTDLLEQVVDIVKFGAAKKGIELLLNIGNNTPRFAVIDPIRLKQVLVNLLSNAVKFTDHGEVELGLNYRQDNEASGTFVFSVRDTGIGLTPAQKNRIFQAFVQADASISRKYGGTGLGLAITNSLVEKMGGRLSLESMPGLGSTFTIELRRDSRREEVAAGQLVHRVRNVLIIDDNARNNEILRQMMGQWDIAAHTATDLDSAIRHLEGKTKFDLVLIDSQLPGGNGLEIIQMLKFKNAQSIQDAPFILMQATNADRWTLLKSRVLGVHNAIAKPVKSHQLLSCIAGICNENSSQPQAAENGGTPELPAMKPLELGKQTILIAEDMEMNVILLKSMLARLVPEASVYVAENGAKAIQKFFEVNPDIVLMDIQMPIFDGISATNDIRAIATEAQRSVPIVALTAGISAQEREKCRLAGMNDFLAKPLNSAQLAATLQKHLSPRAEAAAVKANDLRHLA